MIAPHGALEHWALKKRSLAKSFAIAAFEKRNLQEAACLHATGEQEVGSFRDFGLHSPIALIPNGVSNAWLASRGDASAFRDRHGISSDRRVMLYLSRVTPKKGLSMLLRAMAAPGAWSDSWLLVVAGPDEFGYTEQLKKLVAEHCLGHAVRFIGPVYGADRRNAFKAAELFVLPTHSEGNPMATLEALAVGVPVLTTRGTPCAFIEELGMGWRAPIGIDPIAAALGEATRESEDRLLERGSRGREYVAANHRWDQTAAKLEGVYRWLLDRGERPQEVLLN